MTNVSVAHNANDGIVLWNSTDTSMKNVSAVHNGGLMYFLCNPYIPPFNLRKFLFTCIIVEQ